MKFSAATLLVLLLMSLNNEASAGNLRTAGVRSLSSSFSPTESGGSSPSKPSRSKPTGISNSSTSSDEDEEEDLTVVAANAAVVEEIEVSELLNEEEEEDNNNTEQVLIREDDDEEENNNVLGVEDGVGGDFFVWKLFGNRNQHT